MSSTTTPQNGNFKSGIFKEKNVKFRRIVQHPGQFIITYNHVYHCSWNGGFNANEAINYGFDRWLANYNKIKNCNCSLNHGVKFDKDGISLKKLNRATIISEFEETAFVQKLCDEPTSIRKNEWNEFVLRSITNAANRQE